MTGRRLSLVLLSVLILLAPAVVCWAQTTQGGIVGTVRDEKGADIAAAKIVVTSAATGLTREFTTAGNGSFRVLALPNGTYEVRAEAQGFATVVEKGIE